MTENGNKEQELMQSDPNWHLDWFLQSLVDIVTPGNISFGITLSLGGTLVTGTLVSGKQYFEGFAEQFAAAWPGDDPDAVRAALSKFARIYESSEEGRAEAKESDSESSVEPPRPGYIHLKNARIMRQGNVMVPSDRLAWWRSRISAVDGFTLGEISQS